MGDKSAIEWTDATWNPIVGCSIVSPGCTNCYAMRTAGARTKHTAKYEGLTKPSKAGPIWTGEVRLWEKTLTEPLRWREPRMVFVNSMGDLFHEDVLDEWIDKVFAVMALAPQHTFQVLTKRAKRMRDYVSTLAEHPGDRSALFAGAGLISRQVRRPALAAGPVPDWPLPNVWLGVSAERQKEADERIPELLATPAAVRFVSAEPLLGPVDLGAAWHGESALGSECWGDCAWCQNGHPPLHNCMRGQGDPEKGRSGLDWVIVGGESGAGARPMHPDWARSLREQCQAAGVPFFFKQWGEFAPLSTFSLAEDDGEVYRCGKRAAGRLLDGREWNEMPEARP